MKYLGYTNREAASGPNFGHVKGVKPKLDRIGLLMLHDLDFSGPSNFLPSLDGLPEISLSVVGVLALSFSVTSNENSEIEVEYSPDIRIASGQVNCFCPWSAIKWYLI